MLDHAASAGVLHVSSHTAETPKTGSLAGLQTCSSASNSWRVVPATHAVDICIASRLVQHQHEPWASQRTLARRTQNGIAMQ